VRFSPKIKSKVGPQASNKRNAISSGTSQEPTASSLSSEPTTTAMKSRLEIHDKHLKKAFQMSRPSISEEAKRRYDQLFAAFNKSNHDRSNVRQTAFTTARSDVVFDPSTPQRSALY
jgi:hypothetical protein